MCDKPVKKINSMEKSPFDLVIDYICSERDDLLVPDFRKVIEIYAEATKPTKKDSK
ncbi:hypothetical protein [Serratia sp. M24T3]|uniref:hypothetical protein n=1 Tax=Serratia sp. M24T3 TaxID=932213 RepID=UPI0002F3D704|nr:hypothetical protein [Serratia sp. M24T3]